MALTTAGRNAIAGLISGTGTAFSNAAAHIGVGDSSTAFSSGQTDLQASTNVFRKAMDATYPQVTLNSMVFRATFGPTEANFSWLEWGVFNASSAGTMLNRVAENNGTKVSGQTWIFTATIPVAIGT